MLLVGEFATRKALQDCWGHECAPQFLIAPLDRWLGRYYEIHSFADEVWHTMSGVFGRFDISRSGPSGFVAGEWHFGFKFKSQNARLWAGRQAFDVIAAPHGVAGASTKAVHDWYPQGYLPFVSGWSKCHQRAFPSTFFVSFCALLRATGRIDILIFPCVHNNGRCETSACIIATATTCQHQYG